MKPEFKITIDLGKGVELSAPFKKKWSVGEWRRMSAYIEKNIRNAEEN